LSKIVRPSTVLLSVLILLTMTALGNIDFSHVIHPFKRPDRARELVVEVHGAKGIDIRIKIVGIGAAFITPFADREKRQESFNRHYTYYPSLVNDPLNPSIITVDAEYINHHYGPDHPMPGTLSCLIIEKGTGVTDITKDAVLAHATTRNKRPPKDRKVHCVRVITAS
jgi:hypothetical protein